MYTRVSARLSWLLNVVYDGWLPTRRSVVVFTATTHGSCFSFSCRPARLLTGILLVARRTLSLLAIDRSTRANGI